METIKKEKKADLEQLLNSLLKKGWLPRWRKKTLHITIYDCDLNVYLDWWFMNEDKKSFRELVSKESNLWQFVCENGYIKEIETDWLEIRNWDNPKHWIVESALCDEDKLEEFLLNNIKVEWND